MPNGLIYDGFSTQDAGMNSGLDGSLLPANQARMMINATARGGFIRQRPGFNRVMQVLPAIGQFAQHFGWLRTRSGQVFLVAVVGGQFYRVDPINKTVFNFTIPGDANPSTLARGWSIPGGAEGYWLYQDGQSLPMIWDGGDARRATYDEIKPGTVMAYVQGRIWYALTDGLSFRAGDLVGSPSGTPGLNYKDAILKETENTYLNEGGDFAVPVDAGEITAMVATAILDTSQGQGPLQVFCQKCAFSVNTPVDRTVWKDLQYPIQTVSMINAGASGAQNTIHVNGDAFMRSADGIRSFIIARRQFRDWGNTPQSFEVSEILDYDQTDLLGYGSAAVVDNRLIMTASPRWTQVGVPHRGMVVLDLAPVYSIRGQGLPHYDGLWTGIQVLSLQQTDIGTFMFVLADDGSIDLWQMSEDNLFDLYDDNVGRIQWSVEPRTLFSERDGAGRPIWNLKKLETGDIFYDQLMGAVDFMVSWRPDGYPCYSQWQTWQECAPSCTTSLGCVPPRTFQSQYRPRFRLRQPPDLCINGTKGMPLRNFYDLSLKLDITGPARIRGFRVGAVPQGEAKYDPTCEQAQCEALQCCGYDPFYYRATGTAGDSAYPGYEYQYGVYYSYGGGGGGEGTGGTTDEGGNDEGTGGIVEDPPCDDCGTGGVPTNPNPPPANPYVPLQGNVQQWQPYFEDPDGNLRPMAYSPLSGEDPPAELSDEILQEWADAVWEKWREEKTTQGYNVVAEQLLWKDTSGQSQLKFNPVMVFGSDSYHTSTWRWQLWISYVLAD